MGYEEWSHFYGYISVLLFFCIFNCVLPYHISLFSGLEQLLIPSQFLKPEVWNKVEDGEIRSLFRTGYFWEDFVTVFLFDSFKI